ncbi:hypothetical protein ACFWYW_00380 [Nonomuraea sp. NPDC059023]|uniref:hypothetical protein n=1 Tax=unclassified Nonomuraea TaxID=2593643 RepID=UPI0036A1AA68
MFFEPPTAHDELSEPPQPGLSPWQAPPAQERGAVLVSDLVLARTQNVAMIVQTIQAFSTGCLINVDVITRLSADDSTLTRAIYQHMATGVKAGAPLPDDLLRFGVRFADGSKATTVGQRVGKRYPPSSAPPPGPQVSWLLPGMSMRSGPDDSGVIVAGLWLWPLPPAEPFELAVEWPAGGVELAFAEVDGAAITSAAGRSLPYWPDGEAE